MELSLSESQAEALLAGSRVADGDLDAIGSVLVAVRDLARPEPNAEFSYLIAAAARESR